MFMRTTVFKDSQNYLFLEKQQHLYTWGNVESDYVTSYMINLVNR